MKICENSIVPQNPILGSLERAKRVWLSVRLRGQMVRFTRFARISFAVHAARFARQLTNRDAVGKARM